MLDLAGMRIDLSVLMTDMLIGCCGTLPLQYRVTPPVEYRVNHLLANLGWVGLDLGCSTILLRQ